MGRLAKLAAVFPAGSMGRGVRIGDAPENFSSIDSFRAYMRNQGYTPQQDTVVNAPPGYDVSKIQAGTPLRVNPGEYMPSQPSSTGMAWVNPRTGRWEEWNPDAPPIQAPRQSVDGRIMDRQVPRGSGGRGIFNRPDGSKVYAVGDMTMPFDPANPPSEAELRAFEQRAHTDYIRNQEVRRQRRQAQVDARKAREDALRESHPEVYRRMMAARQQRTAARQQAANPNAAAGTTQPATGTAAAAAGGTGTSTGTTPNAADGSSPPTSGGETDTTTASLTGRPAPRSAGAPGGPTRADASIDAAMGRLGGMGGSKMADDSTGVMRNVGKNSPGSGMPVQQQVRQSGTQAVGNGLTRCSTKAAEDACYAFEAGFAKAACELGFTQEQYERFYAIAFDQFRS